MQSCATGGGQAQAQSGPMALEPEFPGPPTPPSLGTGGAGVGGLPVQRRRPRLGCEKHLPRLEDSSSSGFTSQRARMRDASVWCPQGSLSAGTIQPLQSQFFTRAEVPRAQYAHRGTVPVRSEAQGFGPPGLGDPAQSCGVIVDGIFRLRFSMINFKASQKILSGDRTTLPGPIPFGLCSSGDCSFTHTTPSFQQLIPSICLGHDLKCGKNHQTATLGYQPPNRERMAVCPGRKASRRSLPKIS
uniref:Uncharacterized protein n=1 Tax=Molossus molossus TaxID=27622 RepID=A0A7J8F9G3_MOLMO|nr:hypothetical protein HJG59_008566 [Molossus molossus]